MYPTGSKLQYIYDLLCDMKRSDSIAVYFEGGMSTCYTICGNVVEIPQPFRMTFGMFRSYATRIANEHGMVIKTRTGEEGNYLYIWRVI